MMDVPVAEKPVDNTPRGRLRALYDWVTGATPSPHPSLKPAITAPREGVPARIGRYAITRKLGEGGMGVVYAARDERLARTVALKTMSSLASDDTARKRFWREARAAASVNHPNVCHIYEIGEQGGELFAAGAILFEMLAGRPAFGGRNLVEILHATLYEQPPALTGSPAVAAADRVIRRALAKRPSERPASADAMAEELRAVRGAEGDDTPALARALTRIVVLPFRILRPDPETDFLAFSLPDAIATSLSRIGSLIVRSSATAARFAREAPDLKALAAEADVDRVVMGTLLRSGEQLRAAAQLVEAPGGTLLTSHTVQSSLGDLFRLQDDIARRVVEALSLPLTGGTPTPRPDAPHSPRAYELYLRANELARSYG